jgi:hypothetical protein
MEIGMTCEGEHYWLNCAGIDKIDHMIDCNLVTGSPNSVFATVNASAVQPVMFSFTGSKTNGRLWAIEILMFECHHAILCLVTGSPNSVFATQREIIPISIDLAHRRACHAGEETSNVLLHR